MLGRLSTAVLALLDALSGASTTADSVESTTTVTLEVRGFRSANGRLLAALHDRDAGFPSRGAIRFAASTIAGGKATVVFAVPPGEYAISCFHDENGNGRLDTNWLGIPKEGVCASNDARGTMGPPKFRDAKFIVRDTPIVQAVELDDPRAHRPENRSRRDQFRGNNEEARSIPRGEDANDDARVMGAEEYAVRSMAEMPCSRSSWRRARFESGGDLLSCPALSPRRTHAPMTRELRKREL